MKKTLLNLLLVLLPIVSTAQTVEMINVDIEPTCMDCGYINTQCWHTFIDYKISGLITGDEYVIFEWLDPESSLWAYYINLRIESNPRLEHVGWENGTGRKVYEYTGTTGEIFIEFEMNIKYVDLIIGDTKEIELHCRPLGGSTVYATCLIEIVPLDRNITGTNTAVCSGTRIFAVEDPPGNINWTWQVIAPGINNSGTGTSASVNFFSNPVAGQGTVTFTADYTCSIIPTVSFSRSFWVGKPGYSFSGDTELEVRELGIADINYTGNPNVTSVNWSRSGAISSVTGSTVIGRYRAGSAPGYGNVYANVTNACGSVEKNILVEVTGGWHMAYPNPANDVLTIELDQDKMPANLKSEKVEIRLYDKMANLKKTKSFHEYSTTLNMNGLKPDVYLLQIKIGDKIVEEKIIVSEK